MRGWIERCGLIDFRPSFQFLSYQMVALLWFFSIVSWHGWSTPLNRNLVSHKGYLALLLIYEINKNISEYSKMSCIRFEWDKWFSLSIKKPSLCCSNSQRCYVNITHSRQIKNVVFTKPYISIKHLEIFSSIELCGALYGLFFLRKR